jgi:hypothetical protein
MYYFVEAFGKDKEWMKSQFGTPESSDISDIEGWVLTQGEINNIDKEVYLDLIIRDIPEMYQDCIEDFKTDYWDGEFTFEKKRWIEVN